MSVLFGETAFPRRRLRPPPPFHWAAAAAAAAAAAIAAAALFPANSLHLLLRAMAAKGTATEARPRRSCRRNRVTSAPEPRSTLSALPRAAS